MEDVHLQTDKHAVSHKKNPHLITHFVTPTYQNQVEFFCYQIKQVELKSNSRHANYIKILKMKLSKQFSLK